MAARSGIIVVSKEHFNDMDFAFLDEEDESSAKEIHALVDAKEMISSSLKNANGAA
jgi:hypothetical protein